MDKYCVCIKIRKLFEKGEDIHPVKMTILCYINDNILISQPSVLGVYRDESEN